MSPLETSILTILQHGDSFFPSGGTAFSWGLEGLCNDRQVRSASEVRHFLEAQLRYRWASCDRLYVVAGHRARRDLKMVASIDRQLAALAMPREMRDGAARAGSALLAVHERIGTTGAIDYRQLVRAGDAPGHLAVVQGLVWGNLGIDERAAATMSIYALSVGVVGAALRLSIISHIEAQNLLTALRPLSKSLIEAPVPRHEDAYLGTPATDIASMRHEFQDSRLFAN